MIERYHLDLALAALVVGAGLAALSVASPAVARRSVAAAGLLGAVLGGWGSPRAWPWAVAAVAVLMVADHPDPGHPLGVWAVPATIISLVGVWSAVPDTEPPLAAAAVLAPLAVAGVVQGRRPGPAGTAASVVAVCGATWVGSAGWGAALAASCAVGLVAVAPLVWGFGRVASGRVLVGLLTAHVVVALVVPRTVMSRPVPVAVGIAAAVLVGLAALCARARPEPVAAQT
jgi:hypothetical protein